MGLDLNADRRVPQWAVILGFTLLGWLGNNYINSLYTRGSDNQTRVHTQEINIAKLEVKLDNISQKLDEMKIQKDTELARIEIESKQRDQQFNDRLLNFEKTLNEIKLLVK